MGGTVGPSNLRNLRTGLCSRSEEEKKEGSMLVIFGLSQLISLGLIPCTLNYQLKDKPKVRLAPPTTLICMPGVGQTDRRTIYFLLT